MWGGWRYARRGRMVAGTGGACGERWEKREDEMREPGAWAWAGPQMAWSVEKALESQPQGWGWDCVSRAACHSPSVPPQALVDDTEDVSLDFGNEEELAFRKAKIR